VDEPVIYKNNEVFLRKFIAFLQYPYTDVVTSQSQTTSRINVLDLYVNIITYGHALLYMGRQNLSVEANIRIFAFIQFYFPP
jgi:hypothetical protein